MIRHYFTKKKKSLLQALRGVQGGFPLGDLGRYLVTKNYKPGIRGITLVNSNRKLRHKFCNRGFGFENRNRGFAKSTTGGSRKLQQGVRPRNPQQGVGL